MNTKRMIAVVAVIVMAFAALAFVPVDENSAADEKEIVYFEGGELSSVLTGTSTQKVIIQKDLVIKKGGQILIEGDLEIPAGVTVTIEDGTAVQGKGIFTIIGNAVIDGTITSKVADGLYIKPGSRDDTCDHTVIVNGTINAFGNSTGTSVKTATLQASLADYGWPILESQSIIVNGSVNVGSNAEAEFDQVIFSKDAVLNVFGIANGYIHTSGTVNFDGTTKGVSSEEALNIFLTNASSVVNIVKVAGIIIVRDCGMYAYTYGGVQYYVGDVPSYINPTSGSATVAAVAKGSAANSVTFFNLTNIKVTEKITTELEDGEMSAKTEMRIASLDVTNAIGVVDTPLPGYEPSIIVVNCSSTAGVGDTVYFDTMVVDDVIIKIAGKATVSGEITYLKATKTFIVNESNAELKVDGLVLMKDGQRIGGNGKVYAATYTIKDDKNRVDTYYTSLPKAIAADAKDIAMLGQLIVEEDLTIPAGVKLTTDPAFTSPGLKHEQCPVFVKEDATLTIADGAEFNTKGDLDIEGTFIIENIDYGITLKGIWADVQMKDGSRVMYTNIYNAFAKAEAGAELSAYNPVKGKIVIDEDLTVPAGMSFSNEGIAYSTFDKMKTIEIGKAVTLTVAGKLIIDAPDKLAAESSFGTEPTEVSGGEVTENAVVKIGPQGLIQFDDANGTAVQGADIYESKRIAGAYFNDSPSKATDMKLCISNIPLALAGILDANDNYVKIYGEVEISDIKVAGTEKDRAMVTLSQYADVTMKNFAFAYASVTAEAGAKLTGDIGTATGKMILNKASVVVEAIFNEVFVNDSMNLEVSGLIKSDNATEIAGIVYLKGFAYSILSESGSPEYKILTYAEKKFLVPAGTVAFVEGEVTFFGDVELHIAGEFTVMRDAFLYSMGNTSVTGTLTIDKVDGHAGTALFPVMYIGGTTDSFGDYVAGPAGNALVTGAGSVSSLNKQIIYLFNGATVSADVLNDWMDDAKSIQFYVDGSVWMTAYCGMKLEAAFASYDPVNDTTTYNAVPVFDNAKFNSWQTYDEKTNTYADVIPDKESEGIYYAVVGDARYDKVYANIDRSIYDVTIIADKGIDDIFIDGKIILKDKTSNTFTEKVSAGTHTISYTLANGYSGNASIVAIDGKIISGSGLTFVIDDDKAGADMKMEITVSGIEKSGYDTDPETHDEKATGLTTTEILLIVVVVIIAIMAVVLILRLNRS